MSSLYIECSAGISGDMAVAALLDAGADRQALQEALDSIPAEGFRTEISRVSKNGIDCLDFNVILDSEHENHDHDMEYLFGQEKQTLSEKALKSQSHFDSLSADRQEPNQHKDMASTDSTATEHRNLAEVLAVIDKTKMTDNARRLAHRIFHIVAEAEGKAHGLPVEQIHFHEAGAIDSIVDVTALSVCFDSLHPERVYVPFMNEGTGTVRCRHGLLPIPVPAVANIVQKYSLPLHIIPDKGEFITPTGAAFVAAVMTDKILPATFETIKTGLGAGKRAYTRPGIVKAIIIEEKVK